MSDWRIRYEDADGRDAQLTRLCKEDAIVQALYRERRQHCRIQIIEGPDGELIDRETFEREHLKRSRSWDVTPEVVAEADGPISA